MARLLKYRFLVLILPAFLMSTTAYQASAGDLPLLTKSKYSLPIDLQEVYQSWSSRGFSTRSTSYRLEGWYSTEPVVHNCLRVVLEGRVEYVIDGNSYIVEPGDEFFYPANMEQTSKNLHDGTTTVLIGQ